MATNKKLIQVRISPKLHEELKEVGCVGEPEPEQYDRSLDAGAINLRLAQGRRKGGA